MQKGAKSLVDPSALAFIAFAWTKWHALGIEAYVERLRKNGDCRGGLVVLIPHPTEGYLVSKDDLITIVKGENVHVMMFPDKSDSTGGAGGHYVRHKMILLAALNSRKKIVPTRSDKLSVVTANYIPWGALSWLERNGLVKNFNIRVVYLDEGIGSYIPKAVFRVAFEKERASSKMTGFQWGVQKIGEKYYDYLYSYVDGVLEKEYRHLFLTSAMQNVLKINELVAEDYRLVLDKNEKNIDPICLRECRMALILSQPWSELGYIAEKSQLDLIRDLIAKLVDQGFGVIIKPHPRESCGKYSGLIEEQNNKPYSPVELAKEDVAAEKYFHIMRDGDIVVGFNSTALVTASVLYNIQARNVAYEDVREAGASSHMLENVRLFNEKFSSIVSKI